MSSYEPILLLPTQRGEFMPKPGGGSTPNPLVTVDAQLRQGLVSQLEVVAGIADQPGLASIYGVPLAITVRAEALSKSRRPYALLGAADLTPVAADGRGEMISRATGENVRALAQLISQRTSKADQFAISTFDTFRVWDPVSDAIRPEVAGSADELLDAAREESVPLRVELFPWLSLRTIWDAEGMTLEEHLAGVGLPVIFVAGSRTRTALYLEVTDDADEASLSNLIGIRSAVLAPSYGAPGRIAAQSFRIIAGAPSAAVEPPTEVTASVGVFDTGMDDNGVLGPWIDRQWLYDVGSDLDTMHGTFVGGLIVASRDLNGGSDIFPPDRALIYDAQVIPKTHLSEDILIERITEVLDEAGSNGPRVWNCSFNNSNHMDPVVYGPFSQELDQLAAQHGVLFIQSAGNYSELRDAWPPDGKPGVRDALATPAESILSLTVGSLSHLGGCAPKGAVASYSRRGPSFGGQQKPDVGHWSGDVDETGAMSGFGICSVGPGDNTLESAGTSFSTPLVSSIAANLWSELDAGGAMSRVRPELVKALVVHSATLSAMPIPDEHRHYYGAGVPRADIMALFDSPSSFTTLHEVTLRTGVNWEKRPFPIPSCLIDDQGKIRAAITLTVCYAPVIDAAFGDEAVRTCVEPSFGHYFVKLGKEQFKGRLDGGHDWEADLVDRGKWSPVKTYRKVWPNGITCGANDWALKLRLTARDKLIEPLAQKAYVVVTLEAIDGNESVYLDGIAAVQRLHYPNSLVVPSGTLHVGAQP